jgi:hypothetical protein
MAQRRRAVRHLAAGVALTAAALQAHGCPLAAGDGARLAEGSLSLAWRTQPAAVVQGQPFVLFVRVCPSRAALVAVDAMMPEHRHGMNYKPSIHALGGGRFRVEGLLWHMSGRWQWRFELREGEGTAPVVMRASVELP